MPWTNESYMKPNNSNAINRTAPNSEGDLRSFTQIAQRNVDDAAWIDRLPEASRGMYPRQIQIHDDRNTLLEMILRGGLDNLSADEPREDVPRDRAIETLRDLVADLRGRERDGVRWNPGIVNCLERAEKALEGLTSTPDYTAIEMRTFLHVAPKLLFVHHAATALIADVRRCHPGEELTCPLMRSLDEALKE